MKDDYGYLRFEPQSELLKQKGRVTAYKIDVERFVSQFKEDDVYLIARIVVFKDRCLSQYGGSKYAVWNYKTGAPWVGVKGTETVVAEDGTEKEQLVYYDENWVDPYCEEVWEYNIAVAGTGYVGLSLAVLLAQHNHVTAVDIIPDKVDMIKLILQQCGQFVEHGRTVCKTAEIVSDGIIVPVIRILIPDGHTHHSQHALFQI